MKKRVLLGALWAIFAPSALLVTVVMVKVAWRSSGFNFNGGAVSFGNDVIQYLYVIGGIGTISLLLLWLVTKRKAELAVATVLFAVMFGGYVILNQNGKVCEMKIEATCTPTWESWRLHFRPVVSLWNWLNSSSGGRGHNT